jgi:hypothetical protein
MGIELKSLTLREEHGLMVFENRVLRACSTHRKEKCIQSFGREILREELTGEGVDGRVILKLIVMKQNGRGWAGFIWLRMGTSGGLLSTW